GMSRPAARERAGELLDRFDLTEAGDRIAKTYSGGMRRRLDLAASLVGRPSILYLDEPTTGLDPHSRNEVWATIRLLGLEGSTVLLTTQYLEEADALADSIVVFDHGRIVAEGTPAELKKQTGRQRLDVRPAAPAQPHRAGRAPGHPPPQRPGERDRARRHRDARRRTPPRRRRHPRRRALTAAAQ